MFSLLGGQNISIDIWFAAANAAILIFCITRLGLLATVIFFITDIGVSFAPVTTYLCVWYATHALPFYAVIAFLLVYGYRTATAGKSLFSSNLMPE